MTKFMNDAIVKASKTLRKAVKDGKGLPSSITIKDANGKSHKLDKKHYMGLFEQRNVFCLKHGRTPKYVELRSTSSNALVQDYQDNGYTCCPTSMSMCIGYLFDYHSESECAKKLGTVYGSGTDPSNLVANAPKLGVVAKPIKRTYSAVKDSLNKGRPVIAHIQTKPAQIGYKGDYGHYIVIYGLTKKGLRKAYKLADPTKGLITQTATIIDKATNGRDIKYYSIIPK